MKTRLEFSRPRRSFVRLLAIGSTLSGALLHGLESRLQHETGMPIVVARDPLNCVAIGSGQCLEEFEALKRVLITTSTR